MAVAPQEATLYTTLLPSHAFWSLPFFFFVENVLLRAETEFGINLETLCFITDYNYLVKIINQKLINRLDIRRN